ncbi:unnamed protein product [Orchesella dallaii]|uniref:Coenzyme Q-binding protein COQ10 START domain-containing protein n=1 Tax=Orchesella dallaii TaxID=48710 RepID=A0ABP1R8G2_9HEXA
MTLRLRPGSKKVAYYSIGLCIFYWLFLRTKRYTQTIEFSVEGADPKTVWEFWADFSNWQKLNPNVLDFEVQHEKGNYENWEYSVKYEEAMNLIPRARVHIWAVYRVIPEQRHGHFSQPFRITSQHKTCIMFFCFNTDAEMIFVNNNKSKKSTKVIETVDIECIPLLSSFCKKEFNAQRKEILENVEQIDFSSI